MRLNHWHLDWKWISLTDEFSIGHNARIKFDSQSLGVVCLSRADISVTGVGCTGFSTSVSYSSFEDALVFRRGVMFQKDMFDTPEATSCKGGNFWSCTSGLNIL